MFCPRCGQERISDETSFCSRCGFLLTGVKGLLETGGIPAAVVTQKTEKAISPRSRGIRKGLFLFLLTFVIAPIVGLISQFGLRIDPWPMGIVVFGLGVGGLLRIAYAMMLESRSPIDQSGQAVIGGGIPTPASPGIPDRSQRELYPSAFEPLARLGRLETNDLQPHSVTDHTTKLLEKD